MFSHLKNVLVSASKISFKVQLQKIIIKNTVTTEINLNLKPRRIPICIQINI